MFDFEIVMLSYLNEKGPDVFIEPWLDKYYPGLSASRMSSDDGLSVALEIFLTVVHVLEPDKAFKINEFLLKLPNIKEKSDFREQAYNFLKKITK